MIRCVVGVGVVCVLSRCPLCGVAVVDRVVFFPQGFDYFLGLPYSHEEGFPGPELESVIWPPVPLYENRDLIQQPVDMEALTPRYTNKTLELLDNLASSQQPFFMWVLCDVLGITSLAWFD